MVKKWNLVKKGWDIGEKLQKVGFGKEHLLKYQCLHFCVVFCVSALGLKTSDFMQNFIKNI